MMRFRFKRQHRKVRMNVIHFRTLVSRYFNQIFSNKGYLLMLFIQAPIMLLIVYSMFKKNTFQDITKVSDQSTTIFILMVMSTLMGLLNSYREITKEHLILEREINGGLNPISYVASKFFVLGVITFFQAAMMTFGSFLFIDFNFKDLYLEGTLYFLSLFLTGLASCGIGLLISALLDHSESAVLPVLFVIICQIVFSGTIIEFKGAIRILQFVSPAYWGIALFGKTLKLNGKIPKFHRDVYDFNILISIAALVILFFLCYILTTAIVKRRHRLANQ